MSFVLAGLLCAIPMGFAAEDPPDPDPCKTCKLDCRDERDGEFEHCSQMYPDYADPQRAACLKSAVIQHQLCLTNECYGDGEHPGPCLNSLFSFLNVEVMFVGSDPGVPTKYVFQVTADSPGTYYLSTANIGAIVSNGTPLNTLVVTINGNTVLDDPNYDQKTDTSQQVSLLEGVNIIAVSSSATGEVEILLTDQPTL
ncbi:MAG: hypothetical protein Q9Q13_07615 [Acidobacteriota bacterium]|nr:hypothetical protein [Acidobacteriota bacterium]